MAKLIVKWRYIKPGNTKHNQNLVKYIATREGVEKCDEGWKQQRATREQTRLIKELITEFPTLKNSHEYQDYIENPTKYSASQLIAKGIDENIDLIGKKENYVGYIAMRPRVEKQGEHGLFSSTDEPIDLNAVAKTVADHDGLVWTTVLSLRREDAERLGYDNASAWRDMLRGQSETLAKAMGIPLADMRWYAAFHNEGDHPHVHLVSYSVGKKPYMSEEGLHQMKSAYANEIFKQDLVQIYAEQTKHRDDLRQLGAERLKDIISQISNGAYENETVELMLLRLKEELQDYKGRMQYGYLPAKAKHLVDGIVDELSKDERIQELYGMWYEQKENILKTYSDTMPDRLPLSKNNEFKTIRNAVLRELENLSLGADNVEELPSDDEPDREPTDDELDEDMDEEESAEPKNKWKLYRAAKEYLDRESEDYNPNRAVEYFIKSAELDCDLAKYQLGKLFYRGEHLTKDAKEALRWLEDAVKDGNHYAAYLAGKIYLTEDEVMDAEKAVRYFKIAAEHENSYAQYQLAKMYLFGNGVPKDEAKAMEYLNASAENGNQYAEKLRNSIHSNRNLSASLGTLRLFQHLARLIQNRIEEEQKGKLGMVDRKQRRQINEKKQAQGLKIE